MAGRFLKKQVADDPRAYSANYLLVRQQWQGFTKVFIGGWEW
jgi:hypothetical protein